MTAFLIIAALGGAAAVYYKYQDVIFAWIDEKFTQDFD